MCSRLQVRWNFWSANYYYFDTQVELLIDHYHFDIKTEFGLQIIFILIFIFMYHIFNIKRINKLFVLLQLFQSPLYVAWPPIQFLVPHKYPPPFYSHPQKCAAMETFPSIILVTNPPFTALWRPTTVQVLRWNLQAAISQTAVFRVIQSENPSHLKTMRWVKWSHWSMESNL